MSLTSYHPVGAFFCTVLGARVRNLKCLRKNRNRTTGVRPLAGESVKKAKSTGTSNNISQQTGPIKRPWKSIKDMRTCGCDSQNPFHLIPSSRFWIWFELKHSSEARRLRLTHGRTNSKMLRWPETHSVWDTTNIASLGDAQQMIHWTPYDCNTKLVILWKQ